jgi:hypothetical protein
MRGARTLRCMKINGLFKAATNETNGCEAPPFRTSKSSYYSCHSWLLLQF